MLPLATPAAVHCINNQNRSRRRRVYHPDSSAVRIEQLFDRWKAGRRINGSKQQQTFFLMYPQKQAVMSKNQTEGEQASLAWLKRCLDFDRLSEYIDRNILTFRYLPYAIAIAGLAVLFRSIRLATKFTDGSQIPLSFIRQNVQLRGRLMDVDLAEGILAVEHLPILRLPWHRNSNGTSCLQLRLAFTSPTISGLYWLRLNVSPGAPVKFRLINAGGGSLEDSQKTCILWAAVKVLQEQQRSFPPKLKRPSTTLNETLIRKGLAEVVVPLPSQVCRSKSQLLQLSKREAKLLRRLQAAETKAAQEGLGLWSDQTAAASSASSSTEMMVAVSQRVLKSWWQSLAKGLKWTLKWLLPSRK